MIAAAATPIQAAESVFPFMATRGTTIAVWMYKRLEILPCFEIMNKKIHKMQYINH